MKAVLMITLAISCSLGNIDIFNKCPDFNPLNDFEFEELFGEWFTLELVTHYAGNRNHFEPDKCVKVAINASVNEQRYKMINFTVMNLNVSHMVFQEVNYTLRINGSKQGLWVDGHAGANIQVVMIENNVTVFTFCERSQLASFIVSRDNHTNISREIEMAHNLLEQRGLTINSIMLLCKAAPLGSRNLMILVALIVFIRFVS